MSAPYLVTLRVPLGVATGVALRVAMDRNQTTVRGTRLQIEQAGTVTDVVQVGPITLANALRRLADLIDQAAAGEGGAHA